MEGKGKKVEEQKRPDELDDAMPLRWVPGYEGDYAVTDDGKIYSYRSGSAYRMNVSKDADGYEQLIFSLNGNKDRWFVHRLILEAFSEKDGDGKVTRHLNGVRDDNRLENLKYGTVKENADDSFEHGTSSEKLSESEVVEIRKRHVNHGTPLPEIRGEYDLETPTASMIVTGRRWPKADGPTRDTMLDYDKGESHGNAKLTNEDVRQMRRMNEDGYNYGEIAEDYDVHKTTVGRICRRDAWEHV